MDDRCVNCGSTSECGCFGSPCEKWEAKASKLMKDIFDCRRPHDIYGCHCGFQVFDRAYDSGVADMAEHIKEKHGLPDYELEDVK